MKLRTSSRRFEAAKRAAHVLTLLSKRGIEASVVGSLAEGKFGPTSDVDFLVAKCPPSLKYRIEADVEDAMGDIAFDVIYSDEARDFVLRRMRKHSISDPKLLVALR